VQIDEFIFRLDKRSAYLKVLAVQSYSLCLSTIK